jgi:hypothetical protein
VRPLRRSICKASSAVDYADTASAVTRPKVVNRVQKPGVRVEARLRFWSDRLRRSGDVREMRDIVTLAK